MPHVPRSEYLARLRQLGDNQHWTEFTFGVLKCMINTGQFPSGHPYADGQMLQAHHSTFVNDVRRKCIHTMRAWVVRNVPQGIPAYPSPPPPPPVHKALERMHHPAEYSDLKGLLTAAAVDPHPGPGDTLADMDTTTIGRLCKARRIELGISFRELAERTGLSTRSIMDIEDASNNYRIETLNRLCQVLGLEVTVVRTRESDGTLASRA